MLAQLGARVLEILRGNSAGGGYMHSQHPGVAEIRSAARAIGLLDSEGGGE